MAAKSDSIKGDSTPSEQWSDHVGEVSVAEGDGWELRREVEELDDDPFVAMVCWIVRTSIGDLELNFDSFPGSVPVGATCIWKERCEEFLANARAGVDDGIDFAKASNSAFTVDVRGGTTKFQLWRGSGGGALTYTFSGTDLGIALAQDLATTSSWSGSD